MTTNSELLVWRGQCNTKTGILYPDGHILYDNIEYTSMIKFMRSLGYEYGECFPNGCDHFWFAEPDDIHNAVQYSEVRSMYNSKGSRMLSPYDFKSLYRTLEGKINDIKEYVREDDLKKIAVEKRKKEENIKREEENKFEIMFDSLVEYISGEDFQPSTW